MSSLGEGVSPKILSVTEVLDQVLESGVKPRVVDVRSPSEYFDAHFPGATSVPLLDDAERAEIGTLFKKVGPDVARKRGLEIVEPKLQKLFLEIAAASGLSPEVLKQPTGDQWREIFAIVASEILKIDFEDKQISPDGLLPKAAPALRQPDHNPLIFCCWRGGARSKSMALFAHLLGFNASLMGGGDKAFRRHVLKFLNAEFTEVGSKSETAGTTYPFKLCVLYGLTGSGKTTIIQKWLSEGKPVVDLEALAHHRGSAFGQVGIDEQGRQKDFENNLFWEITKLVRRGEKTIVVEGESRRIGLCNLPEKFMTAMEKGIHVRVSIPLEARVRNIMMEYVEKVPEDRMRAEARRALDAISRRLGGAKHKELSTLLDQRDYTKFTEELLVNYYDKNYANGRAPEEFFHATISSAGEWEALKSLFWAVPKVPER